VRRIIELGKAMGKKIFSEMVDINPDEIIDEVEMLGILTTC
jgi:hypothetical protein